MKGLDDAARFEGARLNQKDHVDEIAHTAVRGRPGKRISVKLLRELLFKLDHGNIRRNDTRETEPVAHAGLFRRIENDILLRHPGET